VVVAAAFAWAELTETHSTSATSAPLYANFATSLEARGFVCVWCEEMANESEKAKTEADRPVAPAVERESKKERPLGGKYAWTGPWGEEEERLFEIIIREFGEGHGGRDSDL
jgi:hypothetical protein